MSIARLRMQNWTDAKGLAPLALGFAVLFAAAALVAGVVQTERMTAGIHPATGLLGLLLVGLSAYDVWSYRLPNGLTLALAAAGLLTAASYGQGQFLQSALAGLAGYAALFLVATAYRWLRGHDGLGLGDAKLFGAAGTWIGLEGLPSVLLFASAAALVGVVLGQAVGFKATSLTRIPFGPFLAFGTWLVWLYGPAV